MQLARGEGEEEWAISKGGQGDLGGCRIKDKETMETIRTTIKNNQKNQEKDHKGNGS